MSLLQDPTGYVGLVVVNATDSPVYVGPSLDQSFLTIIPSGSPVNVLNTVNADIVWLMVQLQDQTVGFTPFAPDTMTRTGLYWVWDQAQSVYQAVVNAPSDTYRAIGNTTQDALDMASRGADAFGAALKSMLPWALLAGVAYMMISQRTQTIQVRAANPRRRRYRHNPPGVVGSIPGRIEEIRYIRTGRHAGPYKHTFKNAATMTAMRDGSLRIQPAGRTRLWGRY